MKSYIAIGVMSGTSLDGLDIVLSEFTFYDKWRFKVLKSETFEYSTEWRKRLSSAFTLDGYNLSLLNKEFGRYIGKTKKLMFIGLNL